MRGCLALGEFAHGAPTLNERREWKRSCFRGHRFYVALIVYAVKCAPDASSRRHGTRARNTLFTRQAFVGMADTLDAVLALRDFLPGAFALDIERNSLCPPFYSVAGRVNAVCHGSARRGHGLLDAATVVEHGYVERQPWNRRIFALVAIGFGRSRVHFASLSVTSSNVISPFIGSPWWLTVG